MKFTRHSNVVSLRYYRGLKSPAVVLASALILVGVLLGQAGCHARNDAASASAAAAWCEQHSVRCVVDKSGDVAVVVQHRRGSQGLVWWDPGGPGLGLPDALVDLHLIVPRALSAYDVAFPVERWIDHHPKAACLHSIEFSGGGSVCHLSRLSLDTTSLDDLAKATSRALGEPLIGAYLQSFGATRSAPIFARQSSARLHWLVLESPGPLPGTTAGVYVRLRAQAVRRAYARSCFTDRCRRLVVSSLERWSSGRGSSSLAARQIALGIVAAATEEANNQQLMREIVASVGDRELGVGVSNKLRLLGSLFEYRGARGVSARMVGLWSDTCPRFSDWASLRGDRSLLASDFAWLYRACDTKVFSQARYGLSAPIETPTLVAIGGNDTVVPPLLQSQWLAKLHRRSVLRTAGHLVTESSSERAIESWISKNP